jgi:arylsulfatase A-like enzyme
MRLSGKLKENHVASNLINTIDLMPTILSLCGLDITSTCVGKDKSKAALVSNSMPDESVYIQESIKSWWRAVVKGKYKYVVYSDAEASPEVPTMLFDLEADPYELNNLIDLPAHAAAQADMAAEFQMWKQKTNDPFPNIPEAAQTMYEV